MDDEHEPTVDSLLRAAAHVAPVAVPAELATLVLLEPGVVVDGQFRIEERLGAGGMGVVYAARDLRLDREVALKLMRLERGVGTLGGALPDVFEREARATARLSHENVVTLHQFGDWNGLVYLVLERLRGESLQARLNRGTVPRKESLAIMTQVASALVHMHAAGVLHRDLKPSNVFLLPDGRVKVLDFGVSGLTRGTDAAAAAAAAVDDGAPRATPAAHATLARSGTPGSMAPEQWRGDAQDARTDVWAAGVMLYQLLTGALPFGLHVAADGAVPPRLPRALDRDGVGALLDRCLAPRRDDRLPTARALADELAAIRERPRRRRRRRLAVAGALAALAALAAVAIERRAAARAGDEACDHGDRRLAETWNLGVRTALAARFSAVTWRELARVLDRYTGEWISVDERTCRAARRDPPAAAAASACLAERREALAAWLAAPTDERGAIATARALPAIVDCVDAEYLAMRAKRTNELRGGSGPVPLALTVGGPDQEIVHGALLVGGELIIAGHVGGGAQLAGQPFAVAAGGRAGFIARIDARGALRWKVELSGPPGSQVVGVAAGRHDDLVLTGVYRGALTIAGAAVLPAPAGEADCFAISLQASTGGLRWARRCGASRLAAGRSIAVDGDGNAIVTGEFGGTADFGGATGYSADAAPERVPFAASWSEDGTLRWVTAGRRLANGRTFAVAAAGDDVLIGGYTQGIGELGGRRLTTGGCLLARLAAADGSVRWVREWPGESGRCSLHGLALHGDRIAATGRDTERSPGAWIAELALADGTLAWQRTLPKDDNRGMAVDYLPDGRLIAAGMFASPLLELDGCRVVGGGRGDGYLLAFDGAGRCTGGLAIGGTGAEMVRWVGHTPEGHLLVSGRFAGSLTIGDRLLRSTGSYDGFVLELTPSLLR